LKGGVVDSSSLAEKQEDVIQYHRDQVRELQAQAKQTEGAAIDILEKAEAIKSDMKYHELTEDEQAYINDLLSELRSDTDGAVAKLQRLQSEEVLLRVMSSVEVDSGLLDDSSNGDLFEELSALYRETKSLFQRSTLGPGEKQEYAEIIDDSFMRAAEVFQDIDDTKQVLRLAERRERVILKAMLKEQVGAIGALERETEELKVLSHDVGLSVASNGFNRLEDDISTNILNADSGIVRIYWQRRTEVDDEIIRLSRELGERSKELSSKFDFIESKINEE
jgi:hypothetical protein